MFCEECDESTHISFVDVKVILFEKVKYCRKILKATIPSIQASVARTGKYLSMYKNALS
jgi:hypothetical protein